MPSGASSERVEEYIAARAIGSLYVGEHRNPGATVFLGLYERERPAAVSSASHVFAQAGGGSPRTVKVAFYVALEAKPGKEEAVAEFLRQGKAWVEAEPATIAWFGVRFGPSTFAIFDAFPDEAGRQAHMAGVVAATLMGNAGDLLAQPPAIKMADVLASKLPG